MGPDSTLMLRGGNQMPVLGIGTWQMTENTAGTISAALAAGYRLIDTSGDYGTQPGVCRGIRQSEVDRSEIFVVTKVEEIDDAYEKTRVDLDELGLTYADLMLIHRPPETGAGVELWKGLIEAREDALTKDIGVSNYSTELIEELIEATGEVPSVNQIEWSPFGHSEEMYRYASAKEIVIQAYSPLTRGDRLDNPTLMAIGEEHGKTPAQVLVRWNLQKGTVPLPKANQVEHFQENIEVFDFQLTGRQVDALDKLNSRYSALGRLPYD